MSYKSRDGVLAVPWHGSRVDRFGQIESYISELEAQYPMVYTYRPWEHLILLKLKDEYGISGQPFTSLALTYRAQILKGILERRGWKLVSSPHQTTDYCFSEVFPNLTMDILSRGVEYSKRELVRGLFDIKERGDMHLFDGTNSRLPGTPYDQGGDILDAIICA